VIYLIFGFGKNRKENYYTTGNPEKMKKSAKMLLDSFEYDVEQVEF